MSQGFASCPWGKGARTWRCWSRCELSWSQRAPQLQEFLEGPQAS